MAMKNLPKRLLVVEDDPDQCACLRDRLELYGYDVACAADGEKAVEMLRSDSFDGIVLDLNLPLLSGNDLLLEADNRFPQTPIILISASQSLLRKAKATSSRQHAYMLKPYGVEQLKYAVQSLFGSA
jgi:DNA-binding response OmpR family regulator